MYPVWSWAGFLWRMTLHKPAYQTMLLGLHALELALGINAWAWDYRNKVVSEFVWALREM
jgi:hypothetical protein